MELAEVFDQIDYKEVFQKLRRFVMKHVGN